jgi:hypothetical protein
LRLFPGEIKILSIWVIEKFNFKIAKNTAEPMYIIKSCPSCGKKLRFPVDKGKIKVNCACGRSFIADPDDTALYRGSVFDIRSRSRDNAFNRKIKEVAGRLKKFGSAPSARGIIGAVYGFKYKMQNFRLLPAKEQRNIVLFLSFMAMLLIFLIYLFVSGWPNPGNSINV